MCYILKGVVKIGPAPPLKLYPKMTIFSRYTKTIQGFVTRGLDGNVYDQQPLGIGFDPRWGKFLVA